jgi:hypothetical protein
MAKRQLQKELEKQDKEELLRLLLEISTRFSVANMYLNMEFGLESESIIEKYKKALTKEYYPARGHGKARSSRANKILKEFYQITAFKEDMVEMAWFQIALAIQYFHDYRPENIPFHTNLIKNWAKFLEMAKSEGLLPNYEEKIKLIFESRIQNSVLGTELKKIASEYYPDFN